MSKRTRFEVFKRDGFQCRYCGNTPPAVILEVDHVIPVSKGGTDDDGNLVTACKDCNSGKSNHDLKQTITAPTDEQMQDARDRAEQVAAYNAFLMEERDRLESLVEELGTYWFNQCGGEKNRYVFGPDRRRSVRIFLKKLTPAQILNAIDVAFGRHFPYGDKDDRTWKYFCGVCWKEIKG